MIVNPENIFSVTQRGVVIKTTPHWLSCPDDLKLNVRRSTAPIFTPTGKINLSTTTIIMLQGKWSLMAETHLGFRAASCALLGPTVGPDEERERIGHFETKASEADVPMFKDREDFEILIAHVTGPERPLDDDAMQRIREGLRERNAAKLSTLLKPASVDQFDTTMRKHVAMFEKLHQQIEDVENFPQVEDPTRIIDPIRTEKLRGLIEEGSITEDQIVHQADIEIVRDNLEKRKKRIALLMSRYTSFEATWGIGFAMTPDAMVTFLEAVGVSAQELASFDNNARKRIMMGTLEIAINRAAARHIESL